MHTASLNLREVLVFLVAAGLVIPLASRFRISATLGFLLVGLVIGPHGLGQLVEAAPWLRSFVISNLAEVRAIAELGIVFLLFMIGLELSLDRLWSMRRLVFGLGGAQVVVTAAVIAVAVNVLGGSGTSAVVLGTCLALSSTAIVVQLLTEGGRLGTTFGRSAFAVLLFQDLAVVPILFLIGLLGTTATGLSAFPLFVALGQAALTISIILVVGRLLIRPFFRLIGAAKSPELFIASVLLVITVTAVTTAASGMSLALGAFLAGLVFAETEYRHEIEVDIRPFKGLLLGLFFISVGMSIDLKTIIAAPLSIMVAVVALFAVKAIIMSGLGRLFGFSMAESVELGLLLGQGGEFAFVVIGLALSLALVSAATAEFALIVTGLSMILTPFVASMARRIGDKIRQRSGASDFSMDEVPADIQGHVVIAGYGRIGRMLGSLLDRQRIAHIGLDSDPDLVAGYRKARAAVFFGDAERAEILKRVGVDRAAALVVTMNNPQSVEHVVAVVRERWPHLPVFARAHDAAHAGALIRLGATDVIPETIEASLQLGEAVLAGIGIPSEAARQLVDDQRAIEMAGIKGMSTKA